MQKFNVACENCGSRQYSFLKDLPEDELAKVSGFKHCSFYKKGQTLFFEDNYPLGLFCINQGKVKIYRTGNDGKEQIIHFGQAGDFLGYRSMIAEEKYSASATALEDTNACFIPRDVFNSIIDNNPEFTRTIMKSLCKELGIASEKIQSMAQKSVRERVAETLLLLHDTFRHDAEDDALINITLPREDIANLVGTATETTIRIISEFKDGKLIETQGKKIRIINEAKLKKIANVE